jgi:hypothetical protein
MMNNCLGHNFRNWFGCASWFFMTDVILIGTIIYKINRVNTSIYYVLTALFLLIDRVIQSLFVINRLHRAVSVDDTLW